jgi:dTDP-4-dehydrorhamnose 3,5-epimerase
MPDCDGFRLQMQHRQAFGKSQKLEESERKLIAMIFTETQLKGAFVIDIERREDSRGFFARTFCQHEFEAHGLKPVIAQANIAFNHKKGTLRGMHFQFPPASETKLVRATRGAILDIIVDLRPESPTYLQHVAVELSEDNNRALYVPERFAHGYQVLRDKTETSYQVGEFYTPRSEGGLLYNDPRLGLQWPLPAAVISEKDAVWKPLDEQETELKRRMSSARLEPVATGKN